VAKKQIPDQVRAQVDAVVERFNKTELRGRGCSYVVRYKGIYLYLDRNEGGRAHPICRLKYNGAMDNWDFAIFKYSDECYDPEEWFFPGAEYVDGTVEGAMRAGLQAYPV